MKRTFAVVLMLAVACAYAADEKKSETKKSSKEKPAKSDKNAAQKAETSVGKWARENHVWGKPRPGDNPK